MFEKTLKIELSPIPQAYHLKFVAYSEKVNSRSVQIRQIHFLSCWHLRVVNPKTLLICKYIKCISALLVSVNMSFSHWFLVMWVFTVIHQDAKDASDNLILSCCIPYTTLSLHIIKCILKRYLDNWNHYVYNKLHRIRSVKFSFHNVMDKSPCYYGNNHNEYVIFAYMLHWSL